MTHPNSKEKMIVGRAPLRATSFWTASIQPASPTRSLARSSALSLALSLLLFLLASVASAEIGNESELNSLRATAFVSPFDVADGDVILDISPDAPRYAEGAVSLNYEQFFGKAGALKNASEIAGLFGAAGIDENDSLVITGECLPCGGGPAPSLFTYWLLKYLGHEKVRILEGGVEAWAAAGKNTSDAATIRPRAVYEPELKPDLLSAYEFVAIGGAQIVDARPTQDFEMGFIPGAVNIPYKDALENESLKPSVELEALFSGLDPSRPVIVYTNVGVEASISWLALKLTGFDARLYTWRDWLESQPRFGYELDQIEARPNPVRSGQSVSITATLRKVDGAARVDDSANAQQSNSSSEADLKLTIKGCATCGFGSPQGFANLDRKDGFVQIGSTGKSGPSTGSTAQSQSADGTLRCTAIITAHDGSEAARTSLLHTGGEKFTGMWIADVPAGVYSVSIVATQSNNSENFADALAIEVVE